ncbi:hypothetical protein C8R47DRAFT_997120 [Mycena vitilis]|nr:hypothetical protein C8R47DRAFT_997120 [Mycena vitilis]
MSTNYAQAIGIKSKWAPIVFAVIYGLVMFWYIAQAFRRRASVFLWLALFSALRVVSFSLRAVMASNHHNAAFNRKMAIAYEVLYNMGFFSLLISAHRLLNDRRKMSKVFQWRQNAREKAQRGGGLHRGVGRFHKGRVVELLLLLSVILGAVGIAYSFGTDSGRARLGNRLNDAATYIFLAVTVIILLLTFFGIHLERSILRGSTRQAVPSSIGNTKELLILFIITILLLLRILFTASTVHQRATGQQTTASKIGNSVKQTAQGNEHLWYPLIALAELLVVLLFLAPGLVPLRALLKRDPRDAHDAPAVGYPNEKGRNNGAANANGYNAGDNAATGGLGAADGAPHGMNTV